MGIPLFFWLAPSLLFLLPLQRNATYLDLLALLVQLPLDNGLDAVRSGRAGGGGEGVCKPMDGDARVGERARQ